MTFRVTPAQEREAIELAYETLRARARRGTLPFAVHTFPENNGGMEYKVNWHHRIIANYIDRWIKKELPTRNLMLLLPPRTGKSELFSRNTPARILGLNPNANVIATSYSAELASKMNRSVQDIICSDSYRSLYPETTLEGKHANRKPGDDRRYMRNASDFEIVGYRGAYRSAGVGGGITGMGGDYILVDDPIKNLQEANSQVYREHVWGWWGSTVYTRREGDGCFGLIQTRWHVDDLSGRLLKQAKDDPDAEQWTVVRFPMIADENLDPLDPRKPGDPLWPEKFPLDLCKRIKASVGTRIWNALYQQTPTDDETAVFKEAWLSNFYPVRPALEEFDLIITSWDFTFKDKDKSDYVAGHVWGKKGGYFYLLDRFHERASYIASKAAVIAMAKRYPMARVHLFEDAANGTALENDLKRVLPGILLRRPMGSKIERAYITTPYWEAGNVLLPDPAIAPWVRELIDEHKVFPLGANDDDVDAGSQALIYFGDRAQYGDGKFDLSGLGFERSSTWRL